MGLGVDLSLQQPEWKAAPEAPSPAFRGLKPHGDSDEQNHLEYNSVWSGTSLQTFERNVQPPKHRYFYQITRRQIRTPPPPNSSFHIQLRENLKFNNCGNNWINCFASCMTFLWTLFKIFRLYLIPFPNLSLFLCSSFTCAVSQVIQHRMTAANNELETIGICTGLITGTIPALIWREWGKPRKPTFKIVCIPTEVPTEHLPNTCLESYRSSSLYFISSLYI
jgi:hypothetical protein